MKKLVVGSFAFVLTLMLSASVFAASYDIKEYCGPNGLINRVSGQETHFSKGDVLNVSTPTIVQNGVNYETHIEEPEFPNLILSDGITINGNGATFDGDNCEGFIMVSSRGATVESTINKAKLTNYGNNQGMIPLVLILSSGTASYAKLTLNDVNISTGNYYPGGGSQIYVGRSTETANTELNIVSSKNVEMSSTSIISYGKLNFKGNNINVNNVQVIGNKAVNDSNLTINGNLVVYGSADFEDRRSAPVPGVAPTETITGEFTNNKTLTVGYVSVAGGKFNNKGTMTADSIDVGYDETGSSANFPNSVFNNDGSLNFSGTLWVGSSSTFNNNGKIVSTGTISLWSSYGKFNNKGDIKVSTITLGGEGANNEFYNDGKVTSDGKIYVYGNNMLNNKGTMDVKGGFSGEGEINNYNTINLGGDSSDFDGTLYVENGIVNLLKEATYLGSSSSNTYNNGTLNAANGSMDNIDLSKLRIVKTMKLNFDVDLSEVAIDTITFSSIEAEENAKISLNKIDVLTDSAEKVTVYEFGTNAEDYIKLASSQKEVLGPIGVYKVSYGEQDKSSLNNTNNGNGDNGTYDIVPGTLNPVNPAQSIYFAASSGTAVSSGTTNLLQFERQGDSDNTHFHSGEKIEGPINPVFLQSKVAIAGTSISQEEVFDTVFNNAGNYTFFQKQGSNAGDVEDRAAPTLWIKAFGSQEDVDLEDYTKVKATYYGAVVGLDWDRQYTDNFDATYGLFVSYIGGEMKDEDWSDSDGDFKVKQNGGYVGLRGNWYIGKLFINGIVDYGMLANDAENPYDTSSNDFNSSVIGLAARVGYNFEVSRRRFTIQPNLGVTGKYIISDDFETIIKDGDKIKEEMDNVTNITIEPGLKLALNLGKCWILSGEGKYVVENFSGDTKVTSENDLDFILPDTSYKNYANVGLGIEKIWGYTVLHLKGNKTFGGRDGFVVNAGIEFKF